MRGRDHIQIVEAAYALELTHTDWQRRLTELVAVNWGDDVASFTYDASDPARLSTDDYLATREELVQLTRGVMELQPMSPQLIAALFSRAPHLLWLREAMGTQSYPPEVSKRYPEASQFDLGLRTLDPSGRGLCFALRNVDRGPIPELSRRVWGLIACHIGIGMRLRKALRERVDGERDDDMGEAVLELDGRCQHAEGAASAREAREILREAARSVMSARGSLRQRDPQGALEIWRGLVAGRWSLIDRFDSDGKHYLIAHKNPPFVRDRRALTTREIQIAEYLAVGYSNKLIGYALGLGTSVVADHIASIRRKLKMPSRVALVELLAAFEGSPETEAS